MIQRTNNHSPFTAIKIDVLRSGMLSADEIGMYTLMMSRTDNWEFSEFVLARELGTTPKDVHGILKRLEQKGFTRERKGRCGTVWDLYELSDQLPASGVRRRKDYSIPQEIAKDFVDRVMTREPRVNESAESADPDTAQNGTGEAAMTNEQMAQVLFAQAKKLKKNAAEMKRGDLPNA